MSTVSVPSASSAGDARQSLDHSLLDLVYAGGVMELDICQPRPDQTPAPYEQPPITLDKISEKVKQPLITVVNHIQQCPVLPMSVEKAKSHIVNDFNKFAKTLSDLIVLTRMANENFQVMGHGTSGKDPSTVIKDAKNSVEKVREELFKFIGSFQRHMKELEEEANKPLGKAVSILYWLMRYRVFECASWAGLVLGAATTVLADVNTVHMIKGDSAITMSIGAVVGILGACSLLEKPCKDFQSYETIEQTKKHIAEIKGALEALEKDVFKELFEFLVLLSDELRQDLEKATSNPSDCQWSAWAENQEQLKKELEGIYKKFERRLAITSPDESLDARLLQEAQPSQIMPIINKAMALVRRQVPEPTPLLPMTA